MIGMFLDSKNKNVYVSSDMFKRIFKDFISFSWRNNFDRHLVLKLAQCQNETTKATVNDNDFLFHLFPYSENQINFLMLKYCCIWLVK